MRRDCVRRDARSLQTVTAQPTWRPASRGSPNGQPTRHSIRPKPCGTRRDGQPHSEQAGRAGNDGSTTGPKPPRNATTRWICPSPRSQSSLGSAARCRGWKTPPCWPGASAISTTPPSAISRCTGSSPQSRRRRTSTVARRASNRSLSRRLHGWQHFARLADRTKLTRPQHAMPTPRSKNFSADKQDDSRKARRCSSVAHRP